MSATVLAITATTAIIIIIIVVVIIIVTTTTIIIVIIIIIISSSSSENKRKKEITHGEGREKRETGVDSTMAWHQCFHPLPPNPYCNIFVPPSGTHMMDALQQHPPAILLRFGDHASRFCAWTFCSPQLVVVADDDGHVAVKLPASVPNEEVVQTAW